MTSRTLLLAALFAAAPLCHAAMDDSLSKRSDELIEFGSLQRAENPQQKGSVLPVPIPLVNPTLGTGLAAALLYLHPKEVGHPDEPTATSGLGGFYTNSESWFAGIFHDDYWLDDKLRFKAVVSTGDLNLDYFGVGSDPELDEDPISYQIRPNMTLLQLLGRVSTQSNWYIGARHLYSSAEIIFQLGPDNGLVPEIEGTVVTSSLGMVATYDNRNDNYYPTTGHFFEGIYSKDDDGWGSDFHYSKFAGSYNYYLPITKTATLATRFWLSSVNGDAPFYVLPTLNMRGFARGRYRNDVAMSAHIEWRHKFHPRWAYIAFTEVGNAADTFGEAIDTKPVYTFGGGIRWQVLENKNLNLGMDFGISEDDQALYIQVGERY